MGERPRRVASSVRRGSMKDWWGWFNNPFVKGATGCALSLFLALNFPVVFLALVAAALCYAVVPVAVAYAYRNRYAIVGKSDLVFRSVRRTFSGFSEGCSLTVAHTLEGYERRKLLKREKQERLRRYKRERNRRKREQARKALA
jgi:hypothetical protein